MVGEELLQLAASTLLAILLFGIFGYEYEMPLFLNAFLVPIIVALGYLFALGLHFTIGLDMLMAMVVEFILLIGSILGFQIITSA